MVFMTDFHLQTSAPSGQLLPKRKLVESNSEQSRFLYAFQRFVSALLCAACLLFLTTAAHAQPVQEPARGTAERSAILNAIRPLAEAHFGAPVEFVVSWLRAGGGWAFAGVAPQRPGGAPIDLRTTVYASEADYMDGLQTYVLLRYQYDRWNVVDFAVGPTDVFWHGHPLYRQVPPGLTP